MSRIWGCRNVSNSTTRRSAVGSVVIVALAVTVWPAIAQAASGVKMYQGNLSLHFFGNDTTTQPYPPYNAYVFTALPLGANCNPYRKGGTFCTPATLQVGAPLTGSGTATLGKGAPPRIGLPPSGLGRITSGSFFPKYGIYTKTYANLVNAGGYFLPGGGPGAVTYTVTPSFPYFGVKIVPTPGKNQFGGVMRLLKGAPSGGLGSKVKYSGGYTVNFPTLGVTRVGATSMGGYPQVGFVTGTVSHSTMTSVMDYPSGSVRGWPWTTGMVRVFAYGDKLAYPYYYFPEDLSRTGYDNRTSQGEGTIQLVTPHLIKWLPPSLGMQWGAIAVLRLQFAPEPSSGLALLAGAGLLGVLYRRRARNGPGELR